MAATKLDPQQFEKLDLKLGGIDGAINRLGDRVDALSENLGKWLSLIEQAIGSQPLPNPQPKPLEVKFVFKVADDHQDEPFSISVGGVTDAEGNPLPDASGLSVAVTSSDDTVVGVTFDPASNTGSVHFGNPGVASVTAKVSNAAGDILGSGAADFTVTTGAPAKVSDVKIAFSGLTEEPPA